jgi:hypothetical protein
MKLYLEYYLDVVVMNVLQIYGWIHYPNEDFWNKPFGIFSQVCTITHLVLMIAFPLVGGLKILLNKDSLYEPKFLETYETFYEENRTKTVMQALFNIFAMVRRLLIILTITQIESKPYFQIVILTVMSFLNLCYNTVC